MQTSAASVSSGGEEPIRRIIGKDPSCDIVLTDESVSRRHAEIEIHADGIRISDLGSTNGTFVNSRKLQNQSAEIGLQDTVRFGLVTFDLSILNIVNSSFPISDKSPRRPLLIGRSPACDLVISHPQVSARHAIAIPNSTGFLIEDLKSRNGTFLNGRRVKGRQQMRPADRLSLGSVQVSLNSENLRLTPINPRGTMSIDVSKLSRSVTGENGQKKTLLSEMSFTIRPGELIGVMGQSGAGKSTLLMALSGFERPTAGHVLINGEDLYENFSSFQSAVGFVPQDDLLHGELTVREAVEFSARLRLPDDTSEKEIHSRIASLLVELGLNDIADLQIGTPSQKVISGGQRKRVNLAIELVGEPEIIFLDEPTSGLSSQDAADVIHCLRKLADAGRTVVLTIHQPSLEIFQSFSNIIYLAKGGRLAFCGETHHEVYQYFGVKDQHPDLVMKALEGKSPEEWAEKYRSYSRYEPKTPLRKDEPNESSIGLGGRTRRPKPKGSAIRQACILISRYFLAKTRDRSNLLFICLQAPVVGVMLALLFSEGRESYAVRDIPIFITGIAVLFFGTFNASREIVREASIARRERLVFLRTVPYIASKFILLGLISAIQIGLLLLIVKLFVGIEGSFHEYFFILFLTSLCAIGLGLFISTIVRSVEAAMAVVPIVVILHIVLAGFLKPLNDRGQEHIAVLASPFVSRWATEALMEVERRGLNGVGANDDAGQKCDVVFDSPIAFEWCAFRAQSPKGYRPRRLLHNTGVLLLLCLGFLGASFAFHRLRKPT